MPLTLTSFPQVPPSRTALTTADTARYITGPAARNFELIETLLESIEATINAMPTETKSASMPDTGELWDKWIDESSSNQLKVCVNAYTSGNGTAGDWLSIRDAATLTLATSAAATAETAKLQRASTFPAAYTENWIFVDSDTGATYVCTETYTAALPSGDRASKFQSVLDATTSAAVASAQAAINNLADDGIITANEKITSQREWEQIQENFTLATSLATALSQTSSSQYIALQSAYNNLNLYLNTTLNIFADLTSDVSLVSLSTTRSAWKTNWKAYYSAMTTFQDFISTTLDTDIDNVQTDETITLAEKREASLRWQYEVRNYANHSAVTDSLNNAGLITKASNAEWIAYNTAYNSLNTYLNTKLDLFNNTTWPLLLSTKSSSASEWATKWQDLTDAERDLSKITNTTQISSIDSLADDNVISAGGEKNLAISAWNAINGTGGTGGEYDLLNQRTQALITAGHTSLSTLKTNLTADYTALKDYLDGLTDFYNASVNTTVVNAEWDSAWTDYFKTYATLDSTVAQIYDTQIGLVTNIVDDGTIAVGAEKQALVELMGRLATEKAKMVTRAAIGVGASSTAYVAAYDDLYSYITTSVYANVAAFQDTTTVATGINRTTFRNKFDVYYTAREDLETAIIENNFNNLSIDSAAIPNMASDGSITSEEKYVAQTYWTAIYGTADDGEKASLIQQATDFGVGASYSTALTDAFQRLFNFLYNNDKGAPLSVPTPLQLFTDMGATKTMDASQQSYWQTYWSAYYTARDTMVTQIQAALNTELNSKIDSDGSVAMAASLNLGGFTVSNMAEASAETEALRKSQLTTHEADTSTHGVTEIVGKDEVQTLTNKTLTTPVIATVKPTATKSIIQPAPAGASDTAVLLALAQTLTNKTLGTGTVLDVDNATVSNLETDNFKDYGGGDTAIRTDVRTIAGGASDSRLVSEKAVRDAIIANPAPEYSWVGVNDCQTSNVGTGVVMATGTLVLPAGKVWKWIRIVLSVDIGAVGGAASVEPKIIKEGTVTVTSNYFHNFKLYGTNDNLTFLHSKVCDYSAEGPPTANNTNILISVEGDISHADRMKAYFIGICG